MRLLCETEIDTKPTGFSKIKNHDYNSGENVGLKLFRLVWLTAGSVETVFPTIDQVSKLFYFLLVNFFLFLLGVFIVSGI